MDGNTNRECALGSAARRPAMLPHTALGGSSGYQFLSLTNRENLAANRQTRGSLPESSSDVMEVAYIAPNGNMSSHSRSLLRSNHPHRPTLRQQSPAVIAQPAGFLHRSGTAPLSAQTIPLENLDMGSPSPLPAHANSVYGSHSATLTSAGQQRILHAALTGNVPPSASAPSMPTSPVISQRLRRLTGSDRLPGPRLVSNAHTPPSALQPFGPDELNSSTSYGDSSSSTSSSQLLPSSTSSSHILPDPVVSAARLPTRQLGLMVAIPSPVGQHTYMSEGTLAPQLDTDSIQPPSKPNDSSNGHATHLSRELSDATGSEPVRPMAVVSPYDSTRPPSGRAAGTTTPAATSSGYVLRPPRLTAAPISDLNHPSQTHHDNRASVISQAGLPGPSPTHSISMQQLSLGELVDRSRLMLGKYELVARDSHGNTISTQQLLREASMATGTKEQTSDNSNNAVCTVGHTQSETDCNSEPQLLSVSSQNMTTDLSSPSTSSVPLVMKSEYDDTRSDEPFQSEYSLIKPEPDTVDDDSMDYTVTSGQALDPCDVKAEPFSSIKEWSSTDPSAAYDPSILIKMERRSCSPPAVVLPTISNVKSEAVSPPVASPVPPIMDSPAGSPSHPPSCTLDTESDSDPERLPAGLSLVNMHCLLNSRPSDTEPEPGSPVSRPPSRPSDAAQLTAAGRRKRKPLTKRKGGRKVYRKPEGKGDGEIEPGNKVEVLFENADEPGESYDALDAQVMKVDTEAVPTRYYVHFQDLTCRSDRWVLRSEISRIYRTELQPITAEDPEGAPMSPLSRDVPPSDMTTSTVASESQPASARPRRNITPSAKLRNASPSPVGKRKATPAAPPAKRRATSPTAVSNEPSSLSASAAAAGRRAAALDTAEQKRAGPSGAPESASRSPQMPILAPEVEPVLSATRTKPQRRKPGPKSRRQPQPTLPQPPPSQQQEPTPVTTPGALPKVGRVVQVVYETTCDGAKVLCPAKVLRVDASLSVGRLLVRYLGWQRRFSEWITPAVLQPSSSGCNPLPSAGGQLFRRCVLAPPQRVGTDSEQLYTCLRPCSVDLARANLFFRHTHRALPHLVRDARISALQATVRPRMEDEYGTIIAV